MPEAPTARPFEKNSYLSGRSLETLRDWLETCDQRIVLSHDYKLSDLVADLDQMLDGMWSDGIDAMGEDA